MKTPASPLSDETRQHYLRLVIFPALLLGIGLLLAIQGWDKPFFADDLDQRSYMHNLDSLTDCLGLDCYGFWRPVKNAFFYFQKTTTSPVAGSRVATVFFLAAILFAYLLSLRLFKQAGWACMAAAVWATAPTLASSYVWLSAANIMLMAAAAFAFVFFHDLSRSTQGQTHRSALFTVLAVISMLLALLCYDCAIVMPLICLLWDHYRGHGVFRKQNLPAYALYGLVAAGWLVTRLFITQESVTNRSIADTTNLQLMASSAYLTWLHFWMWLQPLGRQEIMGTYIWGESAPLWWVAACWVLLGVPLLYAVATFARRSLPALAILWLYITFSTVSNILPLRNGPVGDYYLTLPSLGLAWLVVAGVRWSRQKARQEKRALFFALMAMLLLWRAGAFAVTFQWISHWQSRESLYLVSSRARPAMFNAKLELAKIYSKTDQQKAKTYLKAFRKTTPGDEQYLLVKGDIARAEGRYNAALEAYQAAAKAFPQQVYPWSAAGHIRETYLEDIPGAIADYRQALERPWKQTSLDALLNLTRLLAMNGQVSEAISLMEAALERGVTSYRLHFNLAVAHKQAGNETKARYHLEVSNRLKQAVDTDR